MPGFLNNFPRAEGQEFILRQYFPIPQKLFQNPQISLRAKTLYCYLLSFTDPSTASLTAYPSRKRMERELGYSQTTITKYLKELKDANLITVIPSYRRNSRGKRLFQRNVYVLKTEVPKQGGPDPKSSVVQKLDTSINTVENNNINNISLSHLQSDERPFHEKLAFVIDIDGLIEFWNSCVPHSYLEITPTSRLQAMLVLGSVFEFYGKKDIVEIIDKYAREYESGKVLERYSFIEFFEQGIYWEFRPL